MYMTVRKIIGIMYLCIIIVSSSCTKDAVLNQSEKSDSTAYPIEGLWIGTYNYGSSPLSNGEYFSLIIKPDKNILVETRYFGQQNLANGSWTLTDSLTFRSNYTYIHPIGLNTSQRITAIWYQKGTLIGTWQNTSPANGVSGTFAVKRVN